MEDTGIGIRAEHLDAIFEDFRQIDQSHTREFGGTGLGLSITRKLLSLMGGRIAVDSAWGQGTHFVVDLPSLNSDDGPDARGGATTREAGESGRALAGR